MADILILTGPPGAGKTSVALALADRYDRVALVNVDSLRHLVTPTGYRAPGKDGFERQHALAVRNACDLTRNFLAERIGVIIDDVVPSRADLDLYIEGLRIVGEEVHFVRLLPSLDACRQRNQSRRADRVPEGRLVTVYRQFESAGELPGSVIDSTALSIEATADRLQALTTSGESIVWRPREPIERPLSGVAVRPRESGDNGWIEQMLASWGAARVVSRGRLHNALALPGFVALVDGRPAGLVTYNVEERSCEIVTLNSLTENRGAGTALIDAVKAVAAANGCTRLWLITTNDNTHALRFYQRRGFSLAAVRAGAIAESRRLKPEIPETGVDDIPIRDEIELELALR